MINTKDYKNIGKSLNDVKEVSKKLDYLKDEYTSSTELEEGVTFHMFFAHFIDKYFENDLRDPAFTYWFLKYNANQMFESYINTEKFKYKLSSKTKSNFIESELNSIYETEKSIEDLESKGELHDYKKYKTNKGFLHTFNGNIPLYEASRVLNNYYLDHATEHDYTVINSYEVIAYFRHIIFKSYLEGVSKNHEIDNDSKELITEDIIDKRNELIPNVSIEQAYLEGVSKNHEIDNDSKELCLEDIINKRNELIPNVSIEEVYNFFNVLIKEPNRKGDYYLSEQKLLIFIKSTFIDKRPIRQSFDVPFSKDKIDVRSVFKRFQDFCYNLEYNKTFVKDKYTNIMFEAFDGFIQTADFDKWHVTNNKIPTIKSKRLNKRL